MSKKVWIGLALFSGLLLYQFFSFNVLQDDAFISFRYVRNFLDGDGLVFNIGERVEGYTNFFWIMLLAFLAKLGLPLIETARWVGVLAAVATLGVCAYAAQRYYPQRGWLWILSAPFLLAANGALAYWAGSGLETALFTLLAAAGAVTYFSRPPLCLLFIALATLTRPEGGLLAFLFGVAGILLKQKSWKSTFTFWGGLALLLLPFAIFKWFYYGSLLPNPFYAKTGWGQEYLKSGLEYFGLFLKHYGLYGLGVVLPILFWKQLTELSRFSFLVFLGYALYVIAVGGDVLPAHRFFVPLLGLFYLSFVDSLWLALKSQKLQDPAFGTSILFFGFIFYWMPSSYLQTTASLDRRLALKMTTNAHFFTADTTAKCFAVSALGAISYHLIDRRFIDMVGLTEPVVAKNPEKIDGLVSTVKERSYNARYVLSQKPDVILFNTGAKPTSLPEKALFLYPDFRQNYRLEFLYGEGRMEMYFRRFRNRLVSSSPDQPALIANLITESLNQLRVGDYGSAIDRLRQTLVDGPRDCAFPYTMLGLSYMNVNVPESAKVYLLEGMERDSGGPTSLFYYRNFLMVQKRFTEAAHYDSLLLGKVPFKFGEYYPVLAF